MRHTEAHGALVTVRRERGAAHPRPASAGAHAFAQLEEVAHTVFLWRGVGDEAPRLEPSRVAEARPLKVAVDDGEDVAGKIGVAPRKDLLLVHPLPAQPEMRQQLVRERSRLFRQDRQVGMLVGHGVLKERKQLTRVDHRPRARRRGARRLD